MKSRILRRNENRLSSDFISILNFDGDEIEVEIIDYNSVGVSVKFESGRLPSKCLTEFSILFGKTEVCKVFFPKIIRFIPYKLVVISLVEFSIERTDQSREDRSALSSIQQGSAVGIDPIALDQKLFFKVKDFSQDGIRLVTSKSNRHLMPGLKISDLEIFLPGFGIHKLDVVIKNSTVGEDLELGCKIVRKSNDYLITARKAALVVKKLNILESSSDELKKNIRSVKKFNGYIRIRRISSEDEFESVLKIRLRAYQQASKVDSSLKWKDMNDEFDRNSIIYVASIGRTIAATVRFVFRGVDKKLPLEKYFNLEAILGDIVNHETCIEISRFAVDPHFQGTDLMIAILRQSVAEILTKKIGFSLCMATSDLVPYYESIGAKKIAEPIQHPVLASEVLTLLLFDRDAITRGNVSPIGWYFVTRPVANFLFRHGIAKTFGVGIFNLFLLPFSILYMKLKPKKKRVK
jgi:hypothetical protein